MTAGIWKVVLGVATAIAVRIVVTNVVTAAAGDAVTTTVEGKNLPGTTKACTACLSSSCKQGPAEQRPLVVFCGCAPRSLSCAQLQLRSSSRLRRCFICAILFAG